MSRAALLLGQVLVLACCGVLLWGLLLQHDINVANIGLVTGMSLSIVYSVAYLCAVSIGAMVLVNYLSNHDAAQDVVSRCQQLGGDRRRM